MSVWSLAAATILAGSVAGLAHQSAQEPQAPASPAPIVEVQAEQAGQRVTISFSHAPIGDVLDWMSKNGASFVAADSELPKDATITLNVKDQPIGQVLDAIASALGGHWDRRGGMRIFRKGGDFSVFGGGDNSWSDDGNARVFDIAPGADGNWKDDASGKMLRFMPGDGGQFKVFKDGNGNGVFMSPDSKTWVMPKMPDMPDMGKIREELKGLKDLPGMDDAARKEMEQALRESRKDMAQNGDAMKISEKAMLEAEKAMEKARKEHPEAFDGRVFVMPKDGQFFKFDPKSMKDFHVMTPKDGQVFGYKFDDKGMKGDFAPQVWVSRGSDMTKLMKSLSSEQREKSRRQGYLRASDLTASQLKMLGMTSKGKGWTITISKDGENLTVKSDN